MGGLRESVGAVCLTLHHLPKPTLGAVEGTAAGAGANLAFGCDLVVASRSARFGEVFVRRALPVDSGETWRLPRLVGLQKAKELAFFGDWLSAEEAHGLGLVTRCVGDGQALAEATRMARRLADSAPRALAAIKRGMNRAFEATLEEALDDEARALAECVGSPEFARAMREFLAKRGQGDSRVIARRHGGAATNPGRDPDGGATPRTRPPRHGGGHLLRHTGVEGSRQALRASASER